MKLPIPALSTLQLVGIAAVAALLVGIWGGWKVGASHWKGRYTAEVSKGWERQAKAERSARVTVQGQLSDLRKTLATNDKVIHDLHEQNAAIVADRNYSRELVRRMFDEANRAARRRELSEANDQPGAFDASPPRSDGPLESLLGDVATECRLNAAQLDALRGQLIPQL